MKLLQPKLRFPEYNNEWELVKFNTIASFFSGGTPNTSKRKYFNGNIPFIRSGEINSSTTVQFISLDGLKNSSAKMVEVGDILYALYGATSGSVGLSKINGAINQAVLCIKSKNNHYFISSFLERQKQIITKTYLQGGQGNLSADIVKSLIIPVTEIEEQNQIANFLLTIESKIEKLSLKKEKLIKFRKGIAHEIFSYNKTFNDSNEKVNLRAGKLKDFGWFYYGKGVPKTSVEENATTPCVRYGELYSTYNGIIENIKSYTNLDTKDLKLSKGGEVLIPRVGEDPLDFANCSYLPYSNVAIGEMISVYNTEENGLFITYYINSMLRKQIAKFVEGGNVSNLYFRYLEEIEIVIPDTKEQENIAEFLSSIDNKIDKMSYLIEKTKEYKKGLLQQMFT